MFYTFAKITNSLAILQGFSFAVIAEDGTNWFLFFSIYLYLHSTSEYCEGAFQIRGIHPGAGNAPKYFLLKGILFAIGSLLLLWLTGHQDADGPILAAPLLGLLPLFAYWSGPSPDNSTDRAFFALMALSMLTFSSILWTFGPLLATIAYILVHAVAAYYRGRAHKTAPALPGGTSLLQLSTVALFVPAPRYLDLIFLQFLGTSQVDMAASLGFRVANISVRLPMFIYANYLPPRIGALKNAFVGQPFAIAVASAIAALIVCYTVVFVLAPNASAVALALYAFTICLAAYVGEVLRFFASGKVLMWVNFLAPVIMVPWFFLFYIQIGWDFDVSFAACFCVSVLPLVLLAYQYETRKPSLA